MKELFYLSPVAKDILLTFIIISLGYCVGRIKIKGIGFGTAGVFIVAILFGHFGYEVSPFVQALGSVLFMVSIGFAAGPGFIQRTRNMGIRLLITSLFTAMIGACLVLCVTKMFNIDRYSVVGFMCGAYTTSPGYYAAKTAVSSENALKIASGYGLIYPVGVLMKVFMIQLIPKLLHSDMAQEKAIIIAGVKNVNEEVKEKKTLLKLDRYGWAPVCIAVFLGTLLGSVRISLGRSIYVSLGLMGGTFFASLLISALGHLGKLDLSVDRSITNPLKDLGNALFFVGTGIEAGKGILAMIHAFGFLPIIIGVVFVVVPMSLGFILTRLLKMSTLTGLAVMSGSMTSAPTLTALVQASDCEETSIYYASVYPFSIIILIFTLQLLVH